ncbi:MAG: heme lyase CcmF/NrfE family subunit [Alphaproteobacteria bacterium]|nr:heme lyase CcmF/NrfE family subunit [Alphaproteobacteria bacterium]
MVAETGHFALILALLVAAVQAVVPLVGAQRNDAALMAVAKPAALLQFLLAAAAFFALMYCYVTSDFSVLNVAQNRYSDKPLFYKITGVWGDHEGSMLLWELILTGYAAAVALSGGKLPRGLRTRALAVQSMVSFGFLLFILLTSNPFLRLDPAPLNGQGLNPLLEDPGLAFHPPILYLGYVGFSMAFSFAIAALIEGKVDAAWAHWIRPWSLGAWCFLTLGITGGSWWAYYTLGWGGWWYWDPTENASFMPWLAGTALLHALTVVEKRGTMKAWTVLLAIITFSLSLLGTFLVRSGVLTSVHSFATDPQRGIYILALLGVVIGSSLALFGLRAPSLKSGALFAPVSREGGLLFGNVFLSAALGTVFLGTLYPLFADALGLGKVSVGPPFFNATFVPIIIPACIAMPIGALLAWKRGSLKIALKRLMPAFFIAAALAGGIALMMAGHGRFIAAAAAAALAAWILAGMLAGVAQQIHLFDAPFKTSLQRLFKLPRAFHGMTVAHIGMACVILGIAGSALGRTQSIQIMHTGESVQVSGFSLTLKKVRDDIKGPGYTFSRGTFDVTSGGRPVAVMQPEKRHFAVPPEDTTHAAIRTTLLGDLYVVLDGRDEKGGYITRIYYDPFVVWIFLGGGMFAAGGLLALTDRRHRIAAPERKAS